MKAFARRSATRHDRRCHRPARRNERAATLVEAAFVVPVLIALLLMIVEGAFLVRAMSSTSRATVEGARALSVAANSQEADYNGLKAAATGLAGLNSANIDYVVVYKATGPGAAPPASCLSSSVPRVCNHYTAASLHSAINLFDCQHGLDNAWCPTTRKVGLRAGPTGPPDYIGIAVRYRHRSLTNLFFRQYTVDRYNVTRIEPQTP